MSASVDFYAKVLGFELQSRGEGNRQATLEMPSGQILILTEAPFAPKGLVMSRKVPGPHIAFYVPAAKWGAALAHLDKLHIANGDRGAAKERHGQGGTYMDNPAGYVIHLLPTGWSNNFTNERWNRSHVGDHDPSLRKAGAPIDYVFPEPFVPVKSVSSLAISSQPPHPHAAALLVDFMLSKKGQEIAFKQRRWPALKELATGGPDDVGNRNTLVPDAEKWGSRYEELVQLTGLWDAE